MRLNYGKVTRGRGSRTNKKKERGARRRYETVLITCQRETLGRPARKRKDWGRTTSNNFGDQESLCNHIRFRSTFLQRQTRKGRVEGTEEIAKKGKEREEETLG